MSADTLKNESELEWDDPGLQEQIEAMEEDDEDLFVVQDSLGRLNDGLLDYGTKDFRFQTSAIPRLRVAFAGQPKNQEAIKRDCMLCCFPFTEMAYWLPAHMRPRCTLEALARAIFEEHTRGITVLEAPGHSRGLGIFHSKSFTVGFLCARRGF